MKSLRVAAAALALSLVSAANAAAQEPTAGPAPPAAVKPPQDEPKKLEWRYARFSTAEYVATGVLAVGFAASGLLLKDGDPRWRGGILIDGSMIALGRSETSEARRRAARASDYLMGSLMLWPFLDGATAWAAHGSADAAWQMSMINAQSFALNGLLTMLIKRTVRRERPWVTAQCNTPEAQQDPSCRDSASFLSGHASTAFTGAGLVCAHHTNLPLYGGGAGDALACGTALVAAATTGALRVVADVHYASDVFAGAALGLASGYLLPRILHYGGLSRSAAEHAKGKPAVAQAKPRVAWSAMPIAAPGGAMLVVDGVVF